MIDDDLLKRLQDAVRDPKRAVPEAPNRRLGKYTLAERLATNAWRALEDGKPNPRVLRVLGPTPPKKELEGLAAELAALSKVHHPLMVNYHKLSAIEGVYFIVRDYVEGRPLSETEFEDPVKFLRFLQEAVRTVALLHAGGITHGGLTPDNIIVGPGGMPFIVDVGMGRIKNHFRAEGGTSAQPGSPVFDVAAIGEILWRMMAGSGIPDPQGDLPPLKPVAPMVDGDLAMFAFRFMRSNAQPFATAGDIASDLAKILKALPG